MNVKIFLLFSVIRICVVVSEDCICYVGTAMNNGDVDLQLQKCSPSPTEAVPSSVETTETPGNSSKASTQKPVVSTSKAGSIDEPTPSNPDSSAPTPELPVSSTNATTISVKKTVATTSAAPTVTRKTEPDDKPDSAKSMQPADVKPTTSPKDGTSDGTSGDGSGNKKRKRREAAAAIPPACCQISMSYQSKDILTFNSNASVWTANFNCSDNSPNVTVCNGTGCNDLQFLRGRITSFTVPSKCTEGSRVDKTTQTGGFLFESVNGTMITSCNDYSRSKCQAVNLTKSPCPDQMGFCCCPLQADICKSAPPPTGSTSLPRGTQKPHTAGNSNKKSFDWKIVGYVATGVICGVFLTLIAKFIYGKKKDNGILRLPNYKYSRLRADYVADDQEL